MKKVYCEDCRYYDFGYTAPSAYGAFCSKVKKSLSFGKLNKNNDCRDFEAMR